MAHIVGVPKREPCQQCGNPVFFAERLPIGRFLYHRTCLKCARCGSQLSPGSFYETEHDGVFCCETCPDEEPKIQLGIKNADQKSPSQSSLSSEAPLGANRQSFSERLAMFETDGKGLLQKSMSDEEKSKSLKRWSELNELYGKNSLFEATSSIAIEERESENGSVKSASAMETGERSDEVVVQSASDECDDDEEDSMVPPTLPKTQPPSLDESKPKLPPIPSKANVLNKLKMQSSPMKSPRQLFDTNPSGDEHQSIELNPSTMVENDQHQQIETLKNIEPSQNTNNVTPNGEHPTEKEKEKEKEEKILSIQNDITSNGLSFDALNSSIDVTKEITIDTRTEDVNHTINSIESTKNAASNDTHEVPFSTNGKGRQEESDEPKVDSDIDCNENKLSFDTKTNISIGCERQSVNKPDNDASVIDDVRIRSNSTGNNQNNSNNQMVRSRLSQFEAILQSDSTRQTLPHKYNNNSPRLKRNSSILNATESGTKQHLEHEHDENQTNEICEETKANIKNEQIEKNASIIVNTESNENDSLSAIDNNNVNLELLNDKPTPLKRNTKNVYQIDSNSSLPPTPVKRRNRVNATEIIHSIEGPSEEIDQVNEAICSLSIDNDPKVTATEYPDDLNPFGSDDEDEKPEIEHEPKRKDSLNPFDSSDDEVELLKKTSTQKKTSHNFRISTNPFGSESEDENDTDSVSSKRTPVPTPRKPLNGSSLHSTPEPSPRMSQTLNSRMRLTSKLNDDIYGSNASIASSSNSSSRISNTLNRFSQVHGSMASLASSSPRHRKGRAPEIPTPKSSISASISPSHSMRATPMSRKKRAAPLPPKQPTTSNDSKTFDIHKAATLKLGDNMDSKQQQLHESLLSNESIDFDSSFNIDTSSIESPYASTTSATPTISNESATSEITTETKSESVSIKQHETYEANGASKILETRDSQRKLIPVDSSLLDDFTIRNIAERPADENITYRRKIIPDLIVTPDKITDRQCEKMKENKESQNKNRQSQVLMPLHVQLDDSNQLYSPNKSSFGKWKRRKGPAPSLPIPARKVIQMLPLQEIRHELEVIEVQQLGLEKQGVILEKMIRERCEGTANENKPFDEFKPNTKEVEDLILQLFELVNEKNELFRRQAELMYLRRQHRLEQEQADIEYEIRVLMAQPECNKTDSDKAREEALISRLVEVVQLRNEVIESLEMDRIREAEEDQSIKERLELHTAKLDEELLTPTKLSKKEKKKQKESKKLAKQKKVDADKDADESEIGELDRSKEKKKKKKFLF